MFAEEDDYMDEEDVEMEEEEDLDDVSDEDLDSQGEVEEKEMYFMVTQSQARKRFGKTNNFHSRNPYRNTAIWCQV